jgi:hypothetical protein
LKKLQKPTIDLFAAMTSEFESNQENPDQIFALGVIPALLPCLCSNHLQPNSVVIEIFNQISSIDNKYAAALSATGVLDRLFERYKFDPMILLSVWIELENLLPHASLLELKQIITYGLKHSEEKKAFDKFISLLSTLVDDELSPVLIQCFQELQIGQVMLMKISAWDDLKIRQQILEILYKLIFTPATPGLVDVRQFLSTVKSFVSRDISHSVVDHGFKLSHCVLVLFHDPSLAIQQMVENSELMSHFFTEDVAFQLVIEMADYVTDSMSSRLNRYLDYLVRSGVIAYLVSALRVLNGWKMVFITGVIGKLMAYDAKYHSAVKKMKLKRELKEILMTAMDQSNGIQVEPTFPRKKRMILNWPEERK